MSIRQLMRGKHFAGSVMKEPTMLDSCPQTVDKVAPSCCFDYTAIVADKGSDTILMPQHNTRKMHYHVQSPGIETRVAESNTQTDTNDERGAWNELRRFIYRVLQMLHQQH